jgi:hypothetical protein
MKGSTDLAIASPNLTDSQWIIFNIQQTGEVLFQIISNTFFERIFLSKRGEKFRSSPKCQKLFQGRIWTKFL